MLDSAKIYQDKTAFFADPKRLNNINLQADNKEGLEAAAQEFESIFIQMMLQSMRDANKSLKSDLLDSSQQEYFEQMYDNQMALEMSSSGKLGLAKKIVEQMQAHINTCEDAPIAEQKVVPRFTIGKAYALDESLDSQALDAKPILNTPAEFIRKLTPLAKHSCQEHDFDHNILLAQAALETGWGQKVPHNQGDNSFNLFGIKADKSWQGDKAWHNTTEYIDGALHKMRAQFRTYSDYLESFKDYINFIKTNQRYKPAVEHSSSSPTDYAHALQHAGYATDPNYANKIVDIYHRIKDSS